MTDEQIFEMARQAGFINFDMFSDQYPQETQIWHQRMKTFAKLVAQHEREACAEHYLCIMRNAVKEAVERERSNFCHLLRQMHDSISLQSDPDGLKLKGEA